jgi:hypothetical protein
MTNGPRVLPVLPDLEAIPSREVRKAGEEYVKLREQEQLVGQQLRDLRSRVGLADIEDTEQLARAIRSGSEDPGPTVSKQVRAEIEEAERRLAGFRRATDLAAGDLQEAVERTKADWAPKIEKKVVEARRGFGRALDQLGAEAANLATAIGMETWLHDFPSRKSFPRPLAVPGRGSFEGVVAALRELAEPPAELIPDQAVVVTGPSENQPETDNVWSA